MFRIEDIEISKAIESCRESCNPILRVIAYGEQTVYKTSKGEKLWVITEADRSATTILLQSEY